MHKIIEKVNDDSVDSDDSADNSKISWKTHEREDPYDFWEYLAEELRAANMIKLEV